MEICIIDNYDSFTYNLAHLVRELGVNVTVYRNDQFAMSQLESFDGIILSPGPGIPEEAGFLLDAIRTFAGKKPMLGVCLGEQAIAVAFGGTLINLSDVFHGVQTPITVQKTQDGSFVDPIFAGLNETIPVGRYHSWVADEKTLPNCLEITAVSQEGQIMGLKHKDFNIHGIQFHPESVLTPDGKKMIGNWLNMCKK
ncbi:MAG: aminodeoxychorismate/anthranilate synthase component II [Bacteroidales bacterium]|nr:aminodeoxychorismate/anthranilate synthase component II [Bacteroidales bacterium]